jgi:hypothetical protein
MTEDENALPEAVARRAAVATVAARIVRGPLSAPSAENVIKLADWILAADEMPRVGIGIQFAPGDEVPETIWCDHCGKEHQIPQHVRDRIKRMTDALAEGEVLADMESQLQEDRGD